MCSEMKNIDEIDNKLIRLLEQDAWQRAGTLAEVLNISPATVRRRLRRLIQNGVLRAVAIADSSTITLPLTVVIALDVAHQHLDRVTRALIGLSKITWLATTTGQLDIIVLGQFYSMEEFNKFLRRTLTPTEGIKDSQTFVCLHIDKGRHLLSID